MLNPLVSWQIVVMYKRCSKVLLCLHQKWN